MHKKQESTTCCIQETYFTYKNTGMMKVSELKCISYKQYALKTKVTI